jgi:DNA-binding transcriptional ArsR family regulator
MVVMSFGSAPLAEMRLAISPLIEAIRSVRVLHQPQAYPVHLPWIAQAREQAHTLDLSPLYALQPPGAYAPDFLNPPPAGRVDDLDQCLEAMTRTPPAQIAQEVENAYCGRPVPPAAQPFLRDPSAAIISLAGLVRAYWDRALARHWPGIKSVLEGDVLYRASKLADEGPSRMLADIDPNVRLSGRDLRIEKMCCGETVSLEGPGLLLIPSAFVWPQVLVAHDPHWQPMIMYPARGIGTLWHRATPGSTTALASLLGRNRAAVLFALDRPQSTTDLARAIGITPGGISQHLAVLRGAGLVRGNRIGRAVLYARSATGDALIGATPPPGSAAVSSAGQAGPLGR